ncbi:hypothetical protein C0995_003675 [Termitomyces sp. Mi166|nr:hypothetical protein C0995_003675 [Termitomyces sp. Mi166\
METRNLPLRILYTISGSQYILARSSSAVPVVLVPPTHAGIDHTETRPEFGTASLKTCLDAICTSSPELVQDKRRDFSVYVLDPLESNSAPARVNIPNVAPGSHSSDSMSAPEQPRGLAVALGLMSWALMLDERDSTPVTGTVIKLPTGQEALEIIFALKETVAMEKSSLPAALRTWGRPTEPTNSSGAAVAASVANNGQNVGPSERRDTSTYHTPYTISHSTGASSSTSTPSSSYDSATLATIASIQMRSQHKRAKAKAKKPVKTSSIDPENSEADRLLMSHYIGPERKKPGRPPNAATSGSKSNKSSVGSISEASSSVVVDSKIAGPSNTAEPRIHSRTTHPSHPESNDTRSHVKSSKELLTHPFTSTPLIRPPRDPEPQSLLDILTFLSSSSSSSDPNVQNAALLAALNAIDSSNGSSTGLEKPPGPLLVNALRELISAAAQRQTVPPSASNNTHPPVNNHSRNHLPDDDVVLLDKENVNPTVFRRRSEREGKTLHSDTSMPGTGPVPSGQLNIETPAVRGLTARPSGNINTTPVPPASASSSAPPPPNSNSGSRRKRTLSDFMDEREASKEKEKLRDREWMERRDLHRLAHSSPKRNELPSIRHYPRLVSDIAQPIKRGSGSYYRTAEIWSSPKSNNEHHKSDENSYQRPITINDSPGLPRVSASSPVRPTAIKFRKPYVVPAWARTSTSMQPRLSEEAARALELAEAKRKEERKARKRGTLRDEKKKKRLTQSPSPSPETASRQKKPTPQATQCPPPVTVASDGPTFAITSAIQDRIAAFSSPASPEPKSPRSGKPALPCTPPRKRNSDLFSPVEDGSLFTPVPGRGFSSMRTPAGGSARRPSPKTPKTPKASKNTTEDGNEASGEESEYEPDDALNRELDSALDELDMPSSSLPAVSSDIEMEYALSNQEEVAPRSENFEDTDAEIPKRQHWVGLPPSSPPPPTSPLIMPQDDESDDNMLPAVTSDADPCPTDSEVRSDSIYSNEPSACTDEELANYLESDFASIFATSLEQPTFGNDSTQANMDLFHHFTDHNVQSDGAEQNTILDTNFDVLQEGLVDFDLTEFWETFKPLLQDQNTVGGSVDAVSGQITDNQVFGSTSLDHMKLAEDVQALFSGCVV